MLIKVSRVASIAINADLTQHHRIFFVRHCTRKCFGI